MLVPFEPHPPVGIGVCAFNKSHQEYLLSVLCKSISYVLLITSIECALLPQFDRPVCVYCT